MQEGIKEATTRDASSDDARNDYKLQCVEAGCKASDRTK
jgi:hypothetical protein